eukprot:1139814-Pelagomonas_calceolata.AAC.3
MIICCTIEQKAPEGRQELASPPITEEQRKKHVEAKNKFQEELAQCEKGSVKQRISSASPHRWGESEGSEEASTSRMRTGMISVWREKRERRGKMKVMRQVIRRELEQTDEHGGTVGIAADGHILKHKCD